MLKKIYCLSLVFSVTFFLSACNQSLKIDQDVINQNINHAYIKPDHNDISITRVAFAESKYNLLHNYTYEYPSEGLLHLRNMKHEEAIYSIFEQKFLIEFDDHNIQVETDMANGAYIYVYYKNLTETVFDINGTQIVPTDDYHILDIEGSLSNVKGVYDQVIGYTHYETITILKKSDVQDGILTPSTSKYQIDFQTGERTLVEDESENSYNVGDQLGLETFGTTSLKQIGLDGYSMTSIGGVYHVYNKDQKLIAKFDHLNPHNVHLFGMFDGVILYQTLTQVPESEENYTYISDNQKYTLNTYALDILTGSINEIDFNYVLASIYPFKDNEGISTYASVAVYPIDSKLLKEEMPEYYIINGQGKIVETYDLMINTQITRLDESTLYRPSNHTIYDNDLNPMFQISSDALIDTQEKLIITKHNNHYGVVSYQGNVLIPFEYISIDPNFFNGYTLAFNSMNQRVIIGIGGSVEYITPSTSIQVPGLYIPSTSGNYYRFYDYQMNELIGFDSAAYQIDRHRINHPLFEGYVLDFKKYDGYDYFIIEYV